MMMMMMNDVWGIHPGGGGGWVTPKLAYKEMGMICPKEEPFSGLRNIKRLGFHKLRFMKG